MIAFDIETGPLPDEQLRQLIPDFDPSEVKCGNLKDPEKIAAKIAEAKELHEQEFIGKAALSAVTGRILAIGYLASESGNFHLDDGDGQESAILRQFWLKYAECRKVGRKMVGHNSNQFDLPFIMRRSWILGIDVPSTVRERGRYLDSIFVDTLEVWSCGTREMISLDRLSQALGTGKKPDGVDGSMFAKLWFGSEADRAQAIEYLVNDLKLTAADAARMGLI